MPKLQRLKLHLMARCQFMNRQGGLVLGLQNLAGLKYVDLYIDCGAATADEVDSLEDDITGAAGVHHNRPIVQVERWYQGSMAHGCSRRPSGYPTLEAPWPWMHDVENKYQYQQSSISLFQPPREHKLIVTIGAVALFSIFFIKSISHTPYFPKYRSFWSF